MPGLAKRSLYSRTGAVASKHRRSHVPPVRHLANPASLISIPLLAAAHTGSRITFGCSDLTTLAHTLVELDLATESDWIAVERGPAGLVEFVFRRFLHDHGQETIAEHFELSLTL